MRRDLENESDLLRDFIFVIGKMYPGAERDLDEILSYGQPSTEMCLAERLKQVESLLQSYYRAVRDKATGKSRRQYFKQGAVDETR